MKNLFKNLMLVAVAAMAFTACSQDVNEVNKVEKKTVISGVLNIENDDTRSGFVGKNDAGDAYVSEWDGDEYIRLYFSDGTSKWTNIDADGNFEVEYYGESVSGINFTVCSPDDMWINQDQYMIPQEQVPSANSVDPYAHILKSEATAIVDGVVSIAMYHAVAYGKMTVNVPEGFDIETVDVSFNGGTTYTIYADYVENNTFWFATEPADVTEFTITAYAEDGSVLTKSVSNLAEGDLRFVVGRVSTFSVSNLVAPVQPEEPAAPAFTSAEVAYDDGAEKYITFDCNNGALQSLTIDIANAFAENNTMLREGTYTHDTFMQDGKIFASDSYYGYDRLCTISMTVTYVPEGYYIVFENVREYYDEYILFERATYTGAISGLVTPSVGGGDEPENPGDGSGDESDGLYDSTYAYVYENYSGTDKEIMFVAEDGRGLRIDFYDVYNNNCLVPGTYSFVGDSRMYPGWCYYYADVNESYTSKLTDGKAVVSIEDGQYKIVFTNMADDFVVWLEKFTFKGLIEGLDIP